MFLRAHLLLQQVHLENVGGRLGHGDDVRAKRLRSDLGDDAESVEGLLHLRRAVELHVAVEQRPVGDELVRQPLHLGFLRPRAVRAQPEMTRDRLHDLLVAGRLLADVKLDQVDPEALHTADEVLKRAVGQELLPALLQRLVHDFEGLDEVSRAAVHLALLERGLFAAGEGLGVLDGALQDHAHDHQHLAVGLLEGLFGAVEVPVLGLLLSVLAAAVAGEHIILLVDREPLAHLVGGLAVDGERPEERLDLRVVELAGAHLGQVEDALGDVVRHERVAVTVAAHPGSEGEEAAVDRQRVRSDLLQRVVHSVVVLRHSLPDALLDDREAIARLVLGRRLVPAHRVGLPDAE
mmetsp:Transcript_3088/g.7224  ORF Transcript_3088/g.7224 Transcript_3088/m.7224 type:complete len:350 (+) Transcript_3088:1424-2473(+)